MNQSGAPPDVRRKRLRFRSWHRGTKEIDLLLGTFADRHLADFSDEQLAAYEALMLESDPDLFEWITGKAPPPPHHDTDVLKLLMAFQLRPLDD